MSMISSAPAAVPDGSSPRSHASQRMLLAGILGNTLEWYDFAIYGFFALVFAKNFFPSEHPSLSLLAAFGLFAVSYMMRPIGGIIFGHIADRHGRSYALYLSAAAMTVSTIMIGLLPTYAEIGVIAPLMLLAARLVQGLSIGGEHASSLTFLAEQATPDRRGLFTSFASSGAPGGILLGSAAVALVSALVSEEALFSWAWRIPFLAGIVLGGLAFYLRMARADLVESTSAEQRSPPIVEALRFDRPDIVRAMALSAALGGGFYIVVIYLVAYLQKVDGITPSMAFRYNTLTLLILLVVATISAWLSDKIGRKVVIIAGLLALLAFVWPLFGLIVSGNATRAIAGQMGLAVLLAIYSGPVPAAMVEMFRPNARCSALALSYNVSQGLIGGTAPMIATYLVKGAGLEMGPAVYLMCLAGIALVAALTMTERSGQPLR